MKRKEPALAVLAVALVGVIGWQVVKPSDEPIYKGKPLSEWLRPTYFDFSSFSGYLVSDTRRGENTKEVVRQIGTNAIPTLLSMLRAKDSPARAMLLDLSHRQHIIKLNLIPATGWNHAGVYGFTALGTNASSATSALIDIANQNISPASRSAAISAISRISLSARDTTPSPLIWVTNGSARTHTYEEWSLLQIDPEAAAKAGITNAP